LGVARPIHLGLRAHDREPGTSLITAAGPGTAAANTRRGPKKQWNDYWRLATTQACLAELSGSTGIPVGPSENDENFSLIHMFITVPNEDKATWVHPRVASTWLAGRAPSSQSG
jgi:hypothetical protein